MEASTQNFISQLREIRSNLRDALSRCENFEQKLLGPRPSDPQGKEASPAAESVGKILHDIDRLSVRLMAATARPHEIFGELTPECSEERPGRAYA